jgi:Nif-specific regulatory protein
VPNQQITELSRIAETITGGLDRPLNLNNTLEAVVRELTALRAFIAASSSDGSLSLTATAGFSAAEFRSLEQTLAAGPWSRLLTDPVSASFVEDSDELVVPTKLRDGFAVASRISVGRQPIALLCVQFPSDSDRAAAASVLPLIAAMVAQSIRVERAVSGERERLREENLHLKQELKEKYDFTHLVGTSNEMRQVYEQVSQVARSNATVLLRGESGTGKEMIANAIHYNSLRSKRSFVKINCAALPDTLIESELFGHERGAFTGADKLKRGRFEMADGGTLFLDEIGDLPLQTQIKLLRVLQEREFERLGGSETIRPNIRLITATNKNLEEAIERGEFREDLYYRLNVFSIFLPPLRERKSDILLLAEHFLEKYETEHGKRIRRISTPAIDMLMSYHFPGNVRELENAIERAVLVCDSNVIHGHHLPPTLQTAENSGTETRLTLTSAVAAFERDLIIDTLKSTSGNVARAARQLESTERILGYKIKKYGIDTIRFRK